MKSRGFRLGCEVLLENPPRWLRELRIGLLANQASVDRSFRHVRDLVQKAGGRLCCLFSPQHGFHSEKQANMCESPDSWDCAARVPVVSLYGDVREPSPQMLERIDVLLIDLQDVGTRVYTYGTTMGLCMEAAGRAGVKVAVLDRPNPIGGNQVEGNVLTTDCRSFVGRYPIPMRHGLTLGEMARFIRGDCNVSCDLEVFPMRGWSRNDYFPDCGATWVFPSPNMPAWETALVYPGMVLLEGTNISEGRGTTLPFQLFGAPFLDQERVGRRLKKAGLEGVAFRPVYFEPVFDKWAGEACSGFQIHVTDRERFRPYRVGLELIQALCDIHADRFRLLPPPYEYERDKLPMDILLGDCGLRERIENGARLDDLESEWMGELENYVRKSEEYRLYH